MDIKAINDIKKTMGDSLSILTKDDIKINGINLKNINGKRICHIDYEIKEVKDIASFEIIDRTVRVLTDYDGYFKQSQGENTALLLMVLDKALNSLGGEGDTDDKD